MRIHLPIALLLLAGCSSHASKQDQLNAAANETTPGAVDDLAGAAGNRMNDEAALNEAARAQAANPGPTPSSKKETRSEPANSAGQQQPAEPSQDEPGNSNSD
jgi:outer membrane murein-binding lipoprotein Lpp